MSRHAFIVVLSPFITPLCAVALWALSHKVTGLNGGPVADGVLLWTAVFFVYHFQHPLHQVRQWVYALLVPAAVLALYITRVQQVILAGCGVLWVLYYVQWRKHLYTKPLLIAGIWVVLTHFWALPWPLALDYGAVAVARFALVIVLAWGYDLLDIHYDQHFETRTLAAQWGWQRTFGVSAVVLHIGIGVLLIGKAPLFWVQVIPMWGALWLLYRLRYMEHPSATAILRWKMYLDSMMLLQGGLGILAPPL